MAFPTHVRSVSFDHGAPVVASWLAEGLWRVLNKGPVEEFCGRFLGAPAPHALLSDAAFDLHGPAGATRPSCCSKHVFSSAFEGFAMPRTGVRTRGCPRVWRINPVRVSSSGQTGFRGWTLLTHMVSVAGLGRNGVTDHLHHGEVEPEAPEKQLPLRNGSDMVQLHRTGLLPAQLLNAVWLQEGRGRARCGLCGLAGGRSSTPTCVTRGHSTGPRPPGSALPEL